MLQLKLYYHAKPYLPWRFRMATRRFFAKRKRIRYSDSWPIDPPSGAVPDDWRGWPNGADFAFVLSHDVETQIGYDKLDELLEVEKQLGFRSVINFIPEGEYSVSERRIQELIDRGFEVGVHGLYHDGKLYNNRATFESRAKRINRYLKQWGATGFRSPLMHHRLDWLHSLDIAYDSSTFDTDPFEPQPDGLGTIFPLWVERKIANPESLTANQENQISDRRSAISGGKSKKPNGYVELPYTLPQDSTLFLLLRESSNAIWKEKTAWIARQGGMVFLNTHPDYMDFKGNGNASSFPISYYADFLQHVKESYGGQYWHATPDRVASYFVGCGDR